MSFTSPATASSRERMCSGRTSWQRCAYAAIQGTISIPRASCTPRARGGGGRAGDELAVVAPRRRLVRRERELDAADQVERELIRLTDLREREHRRRVSLVASAAPSRRPPRRAR